MMQVRARLDLPALEPGLPPLPYGQEAREMPTADYYAIVDARRAYRCGEQS